MSKKKSIFNTQDEAELFHSRDFWCEPDNLIEDLIVSLAPHSEVYYSKCCPIFSFEIQKLESLNLFTSVLLRDGMNFILDFFLRFPEPKNIRTKVLIHKDLGNLVPEAWDDNVLLYGLRSNHDVEIKKALYVVNVKGLDDEFLENVTADLEELNKLGANKISILPSIVSSNGRDSHIENPSRIARFVKSISHKELDYLCMKDLEGVDLNGTLLSFEKGLSLWCSDSFIRQLALSNGASEVLIEGALKPIESLDLSLNHELEVFELESHLDKMVRASLWKLVESTGIQSNSMGSINRIDGGLDDYLNPDIKAIGKEYLKYLRGYKTLFSNGK